MVALGALAVMAAAPLVLAKDSSAVAAAKAATVRFHSLKQAEQAGYGPFYICTDNEALDAAMGQHYADGSRIDDQVLDVTNPEAIVHEPKNNGYDLVGLDTSSSPRAGTRTTTRRRSCSAGRSRRPGRQPLRIPRSRNDAWLYRSNPRGMFDDWNPNVSCKGNQATPPDSSLPPGRSPGTVRRAAVRSCPGRPIRPERCPRPMRAISRRAAVTTAPARHAPSARYDRRELRKAPHAARNTAPSSIRAPGAPDGVGTALLRRSVHPVHAGPHGAPQRGSAAGDPHGLRRRLRLAPDPCCAVDS